jgi:hypothetical protein
VWWGAIVEEGERSPQGRHQRARSTVPVENMRWTAKLRKIEKQFDGLPPDPSPAAIRIKRDVERRIRERREGQFRMFGTWGRLTLVAALASGITFWWPYPHACGADFLQYGAVAALVVIGGVWTMVSSWRARLGVAHTIALGLLLWGLGLVSLQVAPRIGLPAPPGVRQASWRCPSNPTTPTKT